MFLLIRLHFVLFNFLLLSRIVLLWVVMTFFYVYTRAISVIANFDVVYAANTVKCMIFREVLIKKIKKFQ